MSETSIGGAVADATTTNTTTTTPVRRRPRPRTALVFDACLCFVVPFLSELKLSWPFAAAPLHLQANEWPLTAFGATISIATLSRIVMNGLITARGDWLIAPILLLATGGAVAMLVAPDSLAAVVVGVGAGHATDTAQVQANLVYRHYMGDPIAQKQALRLQAFATVMGYSSGALLGGALYEHAGFHACAVLQVAILGTMAVVAALLPVVHASFAESCGCRRHDVSVESSATTSTTTAAPAAAPAGDDEALLTVRSTTTRWLLLPVSIVWLSDGANIFCYICEWTLFAVYFADAFNWSSTLTGAAQSAGDLLAAAILALSATRHWERLLRAKGVGGRSSRQLDRVLLQPPWNLGLFFGAYAVTFVMLAQPVFAVSVIGQIFMGTIYVFNKQAVQESYIILSHASLPLFRTLELGGSIAFNLAMASSSILSVLVYENVGWTAPFYVVAGVTTAWTLLVVSYFLIRHRGKLGTAFAAAEAALLDELRESRARRASTTNTGTAKDEAPAIVGSSRA